MLTARMQNSPTIALLSVTCDGSVSSDALMDSARQDVAGGSLIEYQITTLARVGIQRFLIEVENVDGSLISLAERCRTKNRTVDFVRTGADLQRYIKPDDRIWVQSGLLYAQLGLIETLVKTNENFVATLDSRAENSAFERIDLNTRWAGVSVVGTDIIAALGDLPEDWSLLSSLLRQAVLAKVPFRSLAQQHVQSGTLTILTGAHDFAALNRQILLRRVASRSGFVETKLFGPLLATLVPVIWQSPVAVLISKFAAPLVALAAIALALVGFATAACLVAFVAISAISLRLTVTDDADGGKHIQMMPVLTWVLIILAMFSAVYTDRSYRYNGLFGAFAVAALAFLTQKMSMPERARKYLDSQAGLTLLVAAGSAFVGISTTLQWIMVLQLSTLIAISLTSDTNGKKAKQA